MLSNGRQSIRISTLPALHVDLCDGAHAWIKCGDCEHWVEVRRSLVQVHRPAGGPRCAGSRQRLVFDLTPAQHARRCAAAQHAVRAANREVAADAIAYALRHVPVAPAVHQIAANSTMAHAMRTRARLGVGTPAPARALPAAA